jgi:hypothetical protein
MARRKTQHAAFGGRLFEQNLGGVGIDEKIDVGAIESAEPCVLEDTPIRPVDLRVISCDGDSPSIRAASRARVVPTGTARWAKSDPSRAITMVRNISGLRFGVYS